MTIENSGTEPVRLLSVEPRIPVGASLLEITDTSLAEANSRKAELLQEMNSLLGNFLMAVSEPFRKTTAEQGRRVMKEMLSINSVLKIYADIFTFSIGNRLAQTGKELNAYTYKVTSSSDAHSAYNRWMKDSDEFGSITSLFAAKTEQLEAVEKLMDGEGNIGLVTVDPKSYYTATYVLRFKRGLLEPEKYQVGFEAAYQPSETTSALSASTAANVQISPYPLSLSVVAVASALLGVLLKISLAGSQDPFSDFLKQAQSGLLLVGPILALVIFNVYEYTSLGKGIGMSVSWRSALLIGTLSGIAQDRMLAALKVLLGLST